MKEAQFPGSRPKVNGRLDAGAVPARMHHQLKAMPTLSGIIRRVGVEEQEALEGELVGEIQRRLVAKVGQAAAAAFARTNYLHCADAGFDGCGDAKMVVVRYRDALIATLTSTRTDANHVEISFVADDLSGIGAPENPDASA